ncbi:hypothetical protein AWB76_07688 [Caballeronia temeraria]|uniref:Uncharacterized protein n=1 Tax=Caballeronia temeraria TaxID=1777137 RepID=A0A158DYJ4_9BURK|nr:hypothetical protein AWB76_07688 [Caballeronia temeraria]
MTIFVSNGLPTWLTIALFKRAVARNVGDDVAGFDCLRDFIRKTNHRLAIFRTLMSQHFKCIALTQSLARAESP